MIIMVCKKEKTTFFSNKSIDVYMMLCYNSICRKEMGLEE